MMFRTLITGLVTAVFAVSTGRAAPPPYTIVQTWHVAKWTSCDTAADRKAKLRATDLGVSFPMKSRNGAQELIFLFGDTHPYGEAFTGRWDEDSVGAAPVLWDRRDRAPLLRWLTRPDGQFLSLLVPGENLRAMDVPLDGIQLPDSRVLLFLNAGFEEQKHAHEFLICAEAQGGDLRRLIKKFKQPSAHFLNVTVSADPTDVNLVWIFGTGHYRHSPIYVAKAAASTLDDFATWQFMTASGWSQREADATPLIDGPMGELSVRWIPATKQWAMMYQRRRPHTRGQGVYLRFAPRPNGPWTDELAVLEPDVKQGIGFTKFMHASETAVGFDDGLANPGREGDWGDPYGPYLVPEWCRIEGDQLHLVHTLSGWNSYAVHLMEVVLTAPSAGTSVARAPAAPTTQTGTPTRFPNFSAWQSRGERLVLNQEANETWLTLAKGSGGRSVRIVVPSDATWLSFKMSGDGMVARLVDQNGVVLRESRGSTGGDARRARWRLEDYRGKSFTFEVSARSAGAALGMSQPAWEQVP
ncbi:MAG TPA: DUF4185 domain-containing protein [Tepidisphaeraceae bacterium]|jgi:hypothetical protein